RAGGCGQDDVEGDVAAVDAHVLNESQGHDIAVEVRVLDHSEGLENLVRMYAHASFPLASTLQIIPEGISGLFDLDLAGPSVGQRLLCLLDQSVDEGAEGEKPFSTRRPAV